MDQRQKKQCISLIEKYKRLPNLWNPKDPQYHNKVKREAAWKSIATDLSVPVSELKAKMRSLMGTFRSERSREKKSRERSGQDEGYASKWFAYKNFDFLMDKDDPIKNETPTSDMVLEDPIADTPLSSSTEEDLFPTVHTPLFGNSSRRKFPQKRKLPEDNPEKQTLTAALEALKSANDQSLDPFYWYGMNLSNELRKYDPTTLAHVKKAISDILFEADVGTIFLRHADKTSQSTHSSHLMETSNHSAAHCVAYLGSPSATQSPSHEAGVRAIPSVVSSPNHSHHVESKD